MGRDTEQRIIAYSLLVVAGVTAVGWFAWIVTAARPAGVLSLLIAGSIILTLLSVPTAVAGILLLDRADRDWTTVARSIALALITGVFGATIYGFLWGVEFPLLVLAAIAALLSVWALVPLSIGALGAVGGRVSMIGVLLAWPPSNLLALALFVAPAPGGIDFGTHNAIALGEPFRTLLLLVVFATITFGPALFGRLMDRLITVRGPATPI